MRIDVLKFFSLSGSDLPISCKLRMYIRRCVRCRVFLIHLSYYKRLKITGRFLPIDLTDEDTVEEVLIILEFVCLNDTLKMIVFAARMTLFILCWACITFTLMWQ